MQKDLAQLMLSLAEQSQQITQGLIRIAFSLQTTPATSPTTDTNGALPRTWAEVRPWRKLHGIPCVRISAALKTSRSYVSYKENKTPQQPLKPEVEATLVKLLQQVQEKSK